MQATTKGRPPAVGEPTTKGKPQPGGNAGRRPAVTHAARRAAVTNSADLVLAFKALGDPTRLKILDLLRARGKTCCELVASDERGLCACDIEAAIGLSQAATSHHMGLLRRAGLVEAEKRGRWIFYRRNEAALARVSEAVARAV